MSTFQVVVSKNGKQLFRTEEDNCGESLIQQEAASEIAQRFPASEGFKVELVIWPEKKGRLIDVSVG